MDATSVYQISLIAAYIAGMVALFAPCCISYLFPAYLGNVFKERRHVLFMTLIYSLGIFTVMLPVVLGAKALSLLFFRLHDQTYLFGGLFMLAVAALSFLGIKLPLPHLSRSQTSQKHDVFGTFTLGIFSGITSACCAPVLIGVIALSSLTPTTFQALGVGAAYVLGMVTPLYIASVFIHKKNLLQKPILKKVVTQITIGKTVYPIFVANIVAAVIFAVTGILMIWLTSIGKLGMTVAESSVTKSINAVAVTISKYIAHLPGLDIIFVIIGVYLLYSFIQSMKKAEKIDAQTQYQCPMHPEVTSDSPGTCPKCGGMELVPVGQKMESGHQKHAHHDHGSHGHDMSSPSAAADFLRRFWTVTVLLIPLLLLTKTAFGFLGFADFAFRPYLQFAIASAIFYFGFIFFAHARHEIMARQYGMMTLVSLAVGAGYLFSAASTFLPQLTGEFYLEISTLIWVLLFGHYLEARSSTAAGDALSEVAKLLPKKALRLRGSLNDAQPDFEEVEITALKKDDIVQVKPGGKIPADGIIVKGSANVDEALISGESKPIQREEKDGVVAGSICVDGTLLVKLTRVGEHSTIGQIQTLIKTAQSTKPTAQALADRAARILTFTALTVALITVLIWSLIIGESLTFSITLAITVLVIACPHALGLAIPTVSTIATTLAVKHGLFIKNLQKLEIVRRIDYIVFDKTGTLTKGEFGVSEIVAKDTQKLLQLAASLESSSSHVIGAAIVKAAQGKKLKTSPVTHFKNIAGKGVSGTISGKKYVIGKPDLVQNSVWTDDFKRSFDELVTKGKTVVVVAHDKEMIGLIALSDGIKPEAKTAIAEIHKLGVKTAMLTGDNEQVARSVSDELGIDTYFANVLPEQKYTFIKKLQTAQSTKQRVMMVGDGINDAPALTQADVGVAIGAGTEVAVESGDIVLTRSNPQDVVALLVLARKVYTKMMQNLWWALGYNVVAIPAAAGLFIPFGFRLRPEIGAILMSLSSVIVVVNAFTLKRSKLSLD
ncbi:heavy metal translocating P-type ATPase [Candidatus Microgenomates bacterium]|nr:MAG: heavy metal translocating P-type ATPase [Candidatus Microgenomates bacterium]